MNDRNLKIDETNLIKICIENATLQTIRAKQIKHGQERKCLHDLVLKRAQKDT